MSDSFLGPLMDDFFAESEEHLVLLRRGLLYQEENDRSSPLADESLRGVLRSLHTLKGLAGMVGFEEAERLAHALEDWIRDSSEDGRLPAGLDLNPLFEGVALLERVMSARRSGTGPVDVSGFISEHVSVAETDPATLPAARVETTLDAVGLSPADRFKLDAAVAAGREILDVEFMPSPELVGRGVGVEVVRERLNRIGEILHASPRVLPGRGVAFRFLVAVDASTALPQEWQDDGMQWRSFDRKSLPAPRSLPIEAVGVEATADGLPHSQTVVRVELARLDELMRLIGEMVLTRAKLSEMVTGAARGGAALDVDVLDQLDGALERQLRDLRSAVMRVRLVPIGEVFERMRFVVRDLVGSSGHRVRVESTGQETEIDKMVVERVMDAMLHLVRNAVTHGIEPPEVRKRVGKPEEGILRLAATASGDRIRVEIADDGRGIDPARVAERARSLGLQVPEVLDEDTLLDLLCTPGFSTNEEADRASGRGVGMEVVRATTRALGGELSLTTEIGKGTSFVIELPLTLMIVDAVLVRLGSQVMAVPQPALLEVLQVSIGEVVPFERNEVIRHRDMVVPVIRLSELFATPRGEGAFLTLLVVGSRHQPIALAVDGIIGLREIVVRPLTDPLVAVRGIAGATELADGTVSLIIDVADLLELAQERRTSPGSRRHQHA